MYKRLGLLILLLLVGSIASALAYDGVYFDHDPEELKQRYANDESEFIEVNGVTIHFRDQGAGPTLLLLHGVNASLHTWDGWAQALADDFRVISLDLPGHGLTGPDPQRRYTWQETADLVVAFADLLELDQFHLAGNSRGGAIAWHLALDYPDRVHKLILLDSAGLPFEDPVPLALQLQMMPVAKDIASIVTPKWLVRDSVDSVYGNPTGIESSIYQRYHDLLLNQGNRRAASEIMQQTFEQDFRHERLSEINHPTLILWGENDQWIRLKYGERMHALMPNSTFKIYQGIGHVPMEEIPQQTAQDVLQFLKI